MSFSPQITQINTDWEKTLLNSSPCSAVFINKKFPTDEGSLHRWGTPSSSVASALLTGGEEIFSVRYLIIIVIEAECEAYSGA